MIPGVKSTGTRAPKIVVAALALLIVFAAGYYFAPAKVSTKMATLTSSYDVKTDTAALKATVQGFRGDTVYYDLTYSNANPTFLVASTQTTPTAAEYASRMVIYSASISLRVDSVKETMRSVQGIASKYQGIMASASYSNTTGYVTVRVPQAAFYQAVEEFEKIGKVQQKDLRGEDVTEQYVDLSAQLVNEEKQEKRLQEILDLAKDVDDVMTVERELERVRGSIESLTGRLKYMSNRVELSTITVSMSTKPVEVLPEEWQPRLNLALPVKNGVQTLYSITEGMVTMAIVVVPFAVIGVAAFAVIRRLRTSRATVVSESLPQA
jgi:hypothetical protein